MHTGITPSEDDLIVEVVEPPHSGVRALLVAAQSHGEDARITADFPADAGPALPIGSPVLVRFHGGPLSTVREVPGQVVFRSSDLIRQRYQFLFPGAVHRALGPVVNRRGAIRVHPDEEEPVPTTIWAIDGPHRFEAELLDVSGTGISIRVAEEDERKLLGCWQVRVHLELPEEKTPVEINGHIRYRQLLDDGVKFGIEFPDAGSPGVRYHQERIYRYVMVKHSRDLTRRSPYMRKRRAS